MGLNNSLSAMTAARATRRRVLGGMAAAPAALAMGGHALPQRRASAQEGQGGILVVDLGSEPENLDPHQIVAYTTSLLVGQIAEPLVHLNNEDLSLEPWLAESWEAAEDGLAYTFTLREGVTFHDGTPFDADAVKYTFDRQLDPEHPANEGGQWTAAPWFWMIDEVRVDDPQTVTFVLNAPYNQFVERIANNAGAWIVSPSAVDALGAGFVEAPVGTGPYRFVAWDKGQQVQLARNETYWGGTPGLDEVYFRSISEEGARMTALLTGEVGLTIDLGPEMVNQLSASADHTIASGPTGSIWFLAMNVESAPFSNPLVRQAVNHAVDKRAIVEDVLNNTVIQANGPLAPAYVAYNPAVEEMYPFDPEKARELLAEAGWDPATQVVFRSSIGGSGMLLPEEMATVIQENLRAVGIETSIEVSEFVSWMDAIRSASNELTVMSWNLPPIEPDILFNGVLSESSLPPGFNTSYYVNPDVEALYKVGSTSTDPDEAIQAYQDVQVMIMEDAPIVPVAHAQQTFALSNAVQGFAPAANMELDLRQTYILQ